MAYSSYEKNGVTFWKVYVNLRSKIDPKIREQKVVPDLTSELAAKKEEKKVLEELSARIARREGFGRQWGEVVDEWEKEVREDGFKRLSEVVLMDSVSALKRWTTDWLERPASDITRADARRVLDNVESSVKTRQTVQRAKCLIDTVFLWGIEREFIRGVRQSPVAGMDLGVVRKEKVPEILTLDEIKTLLWSAQQLDCPWLPIWSVALLTGMRNGELHALLWSDVDFERRLITVSKSYNTRLRRVMVDQTKGGKWRKVPISPDLYDILLEMRKDAGDRPEVLPRFWQWDKGEQARILRGFCKSVGIRSVRFHTLRACFATQLLSLGVSSARVMKVCGWEDLRTMQSYIRFAGMDEVGATDNLKIRVSDEEAVAIAAKAFELRAKSKGVKLLENGAKEVQSGLAKAG